MEDAARERGSGQQREQERRIDRASTRGEARKREGSEAHDHGDGIGVEQTVLVENRRGAHCEEDSRQQCGQGRNAEPSHQCMQRESQRQPQCEKAGLEPDRRRIAAELEPEPEEQVEQGRLGVLIVDTSPKVSTQDLDVEELPVPGLGTVVEAYAGRMVEQPRGSEDQHQDRGRGDARAPELFHAAQSMTPRASMPSRRASRVRTNRWLAETDPASCTCEN